MDTVESRLASWAKMLLDLSYRNRLLNLPMTAPSAPRQRTLRFQKPDPSTIYSMLLEDGIIAIESPPDFDPKRVDKGSDTNEKVDGREKIREEPTASVCETPLAPRTALTLQPATVANRLALRLMRQSRTLLSEQGINTLFATFGVLKWRDTKEKRERRAPLLLVPVELYEDSRHQTFKLRRIDENVEFNSTLAERISGDFGLSISPPSPDEEHEYSFDDVLTHVRSEIRDRDEWEVLDETHVGSFQFHKIRMFRDLLDHTDVASAHSVIQALATKGMLVEAPIDLPSRSNLDRELQSSESYSILDADSSQMEVIEAVKRGAHLIVQGPPGTGKSQTIANIIAESIAQRKTVLFVSEKAAALDVVYRRLEESGLGPYCLPLHSHKANKAKIISDLHARMEQQVSGTGPLLVERELEEHDELRLRLNSYPDALHRIREPLGSSIFSVLGRLTKLGELPDAAALPIPSVAGLTEGRLDSWHTAVTNAARYHHVMLQGNRHTWTVMKERSLSLAEQDDLRTALTSFKQVLNQFLNVSETLSNTLGVSPPVSVADADRLKALVRLPPERLSVAPECLDPIVARDTIQLTRDARERLDRMGQVTSEILASFTESVFSLPHESLLITYQQGFLSRTFSSSHRHNRRAVQAAALPNVKTSERTERDAIQRLSDLSPEVQWFDEHSNRLSSLLGIALHRSWSTEAGILDKPLAELEQLSRLMDEYPSRHLPPTLVSVLKNGIMDSLLEESAHLTKQVNELSRSARALAQLLPGNSWQIEGLDWQDVALADLQQWVTTRLESFEGLEEWMQTRNALNKISVLGLDQTITQLMTMDVGPSSWAGLLAKKVLSRWVIEQMSSDDVLASFTRQDQDQAIERFRELDSRVIASGARRVHDHLATYGYSDAGEPQILQREFNKKRRKLPLRTLFQRIPNLLQELKPCLMMSPLSVAHFLSANLFTFDLVIFDEASQVRPHDAIGAIMRGKQLVVAGDSKQLPPTSFFDRDIDTDDEEDSLPDMESVLDALGSTGIKHLPLLWHYRSRHEDLIAFSNRFVYDDKLRTFPTPKYGKTPDAGVHFRYVSDGRLTRERDKHTNREQKRNREEVNEVVKLVTEHFRACPDRSLGVVALNKWHAEAIRDAIHDAQLLDRSLDEWIERDCEEPFFVKNLEEVQGDERDVMIVSIGFAKEGVGEDAKLNHNFGPINQEIGKRRINVLVTRSKHKLILVSSIHDEDIRDSVSRVGGLWLLKQYLAYAEKGPDFLEQRVGIVEGEAESAFEEEVANTIRKLGYDARLQVGVSKYRIDIGVVDPNDSTRFLMGVECDGATYHSSKVARDRDRLRQAVLEELGWRIHRIWSTEWFRNRDPEVSRLAMALEHAAITASRTPTRVETSALSTNTMQQLKPVPASADTEPTQDSSKIQSSREPTALRMLPDYKAVLYQVANLSKESVISELYQAPPSLIESLILQCVEVEGPIHVDLLVKRIASVWGYERAGSRIRNRIDSVLNRHIRSGGKIKRSGEYLSIANKPIPAARGADKDGNVRKIDWIPSEELQVAFVAVLRRALSLGPNEMITETARFLGYNRTGRAIKSRFELELGQAVSGGSLEILNGRYQLTSVSDRQLSRRNST